MVKKTPGPKGGLSKKEKGKVVNLIRAKWKVNMKSKPGNPKKIKAVTIANEIATLLGLSATTILNFVRNNKIIDVVKSEQFNDVPDLSNTSSGTTDNETLKTPCTPCARKVSAAEANATFKKIGMNMGGLKKDKVKPDASDDTSDFGGFGGFDDQDVAKVEQDYLKQVLQQVHEMYESAKSKSQNLSKNWKYPIPSLWIHPNNPIVTDKIWNKSSVSRMCLPSVYVFDCEMWTRKVQLYCPHCETTQDTKLRDSRFKRVTSITGYYYILYRTKRCSSKTCPKVMELAAAYKTKKKGTNKNYVPSTTYSVFHPGTHAALPRDVRELFPAVYADGSPRSIALDKSVINLMMACCGDSAGMSVAAFVRALQETHSLDRTSKRLQYYSRAADRLKAEQEINGSNKNCDPDVPKFPDDSHFHSFPSERTFSRHHADNLQHRKKHNEARLSMEVMGEQCGMILKGDDTYKTNKFVRVGVSGETQSHACTFTVMSGHGVILYSGFMHSERDDEKQIALTELASRIEEAGLSVALVYTDLCCHQQNLWESAFSRLKTNIPSSSGNEINSCSSFGAIQFSEPIYITDESKGETACHIILTAIKHGKSMQPVVAVDLEWTPQIFPNLPEPARSGRLGHIQIATCPYSDTDNGSVYIFYVYKWGKLPASMLSILADNSIEKVGCYIAADVRKLNMDINFPHACVNNVVDICKQAKALGVIPTAKVSLDLLCRTVLNLRLEKVHQRSRWHINLLETGENHLITYAGMDAAVTMTINRKLAVAEVEMRTGLTMQGSPVVIVDRTFKIQAYGFVVYQIDYTDEIVVTIDRSKPVNKLFVTDKINSTTIGDNMQDETAVVTVNLKNLLKFHDLHSRFAEVSEKLETASQEQNHWHNQFCKLDLLHAEQRITNLLPKDHGSFKRFSRRLADAFAEVAQEDVLDGIARLRQNGLEDFEIDLFMYFEYPKFIRRCRRSVPPPQKLKERLTSVYREYMDSVDAETKTPLFSNAAKHAWKNLIGHVEKGCLSDIPWIPYYYTVHRGNQHDGGDDGEIRCIRGSSSLENWHLHLANLFHGGHTFSTDRAQSALAEYITRWNSRVKHRARGEPDYLHYDFSIMEEIVLLAETCGVIEYPFLQITSDFKINQKHTFYASRAWEDSSYANIMSENDFDGSDIPSAQIQGGFEAIIQQVRRPVHLALHELVEGETVDHTLSPSKKKKKSTKGSLVVSKCMTIAEKRLFNELYLRFDLKQSTSELFSKIWNVFADRISHERSSDEPVVRRINQELALDLLSNFKSGEKARKTLYQHSTEDKQLRKRLRCNDDPNESAPVQVVTPKQRSADVDRVDPILYQQPNVGSATASQRVFQEQREKELSSVKQRSPRYCPQCGHNMSHVDFISLHRRGRRGRGNGKGGGKPVCLVQEKAKVKRILRSRDRRHDKNFKSNTPMANMLSMCGCQYCFKDISHPPGCMVLKSQPHKNHQGARSVKVNPSLMKGFTKIRRTNAFKSTCTTKSSNLPRSKEGGRLTLEQANQIYQDRQANELQDFLNRTNCQIFDGKLLGDLFTVRNVDGDGSCFYRAASITSTTTDRFGTIANIRSKVADYLLRHKDVLSEFNYHSANWGNYVENVRSQNEWADHVSIKGFVEIYNVVVIIIIATPDGIDLTVISPQQQQKRRRQPSSPAIFLFFDRISEHYFSLVPKLDSCISVVKASAQREDAEYIFRTKDPLILSIRTVAESFFESASWTGAASQSTFEALQRLAYGLEASQVPKRLFDGKLHARAAKYNSLPEINGYLDDVLVNAYIQACVHQSPEYTSLSSLYAVKNPVESLSRAVKKSLFGDSTAKSELRESSKLVLLPMCHKKHWVLACIRFSNTTCILYNSLPGTCTDYIDILNRNFSKLDMGNQIWKFDIKDDKTWCVQSSNYSCGDYTCMAANTIVQGSGTVDTPILNPNCWRFELLSYLEAVTFDTQSIRTAEAAAEAAAPPS